MGALMTDDSVVFQQTGSSVQRLCPRYDGVMHPPSTLPLPPRVIRQLDGRADRALRVTVCEGPDAGHAAAIGQQAIIGRGETANVKLSDSSVSQFHLELSLGPEGIVVVDMNSTNGTWIGGVRIERALVPPTTYLSLGQSVVRVDVSRIQEKPAEVPEKFGGLVGSSLPMRELYALLGRLARTDLSVVLQGETGTGKEEIARALHQQSRRAAGPFIVLDCGALPETLAESILFGHEKGAFTGASERRLGVFEAAQGGVLFIDEIGELALSLQPLLLRAIQQREVTPLGSVRPRRFDARIICASWRELRVLVNQGRFREDLYYRLAQATVHVPALSERREDISLFVEHFLKQLPAHAPAARAFSASALSALQERHFQGNIRELRNLVERAALLSDKEEVTAEDLMIERALCGLRDRGGSYTESELDRETSTDPNQAPLNFFREAKQTAVEAFERRYLQRLLERVGRNVTRAAALAGLERHNLRALLRKHGLYASD